MSDELVELASLVGDDDPPLAEVGDDDPPLAEVGDDDPPEALVLAELAPLVGVADPPATVVAIELESLVGADDPPLAALLADTLARSGAVINRQSTRLTASTSSLSLTLNVAVLELSIRLT